MSDAPLDPRLDSNAVETSTPERRRSEWAEFRHSYPGLIVTMGIALIALLAMDVWIMAKRRRYEAEIDRLRAAMTDFERRRTDQIVSQEQHKLRIAIELFKRQSRLEKGIHLSVSIDSNAMYLEREGALLREMPVEIGSERRVGVGPDTVRLAPPRGVRTIARVLTDSESYELPTWVYADQGIPTARNRRVVGALGPLALLLDGGTIVYSMPSTGPLSDSGYVLPGAVRARAEDLRAILANLTAGTRVYFY